MRGRKIVKKYLLHSPYNEVVKTVCYNRLNYTARNILKSPSLSDATFDEIKHIVKYECEQLCKKSPSPFCLRVAAVTVFKWEHLIEELRNTAPVLTSAVAMEATQAKPNVTATCMAA